MLPFARSWTMGNIHDAGTCAGIPAPGKLLYSAESIPWPQVRCHELFRNEMMLVDERSPCYELKTNTKKLAMATTTFSTGKASTRMDGNGMCVKSSLEQVPLPKATILENVQYESPLLPGLPDDVAKHCLALVPRVHSQSLGAVCKSWRKYIQSKEFYMVRKLAGALEEWIYVLTADSDGKRSRWQVLNSLQGIWKPLPPMPGPAKTSFGVVVIDGKLLVMAGLVEDDAGNAQASADVYKYDSALNSWSVLAKMKAARYEFACAVVDGLVYAVGGHGVGGENLSSVEVFDPKKNQWTMIESLRRPRWGCFAYGLEGNLYVMGGRSSFTIGNSRCIDVYNSQSRTWAEIKNGCVMVVAHAVLDKKLFCMEWKNDRKLAVFNALDSSWKRVPVPLTGSLTVGFCFGILNGKLLLFSTKTEPLYKTLVYDPNAVAGTEWQTTDIRPLGTCIYSVTITA